MLFADLTRNGPIWRKSNSQSKNAFKASSGLHTIGSSCGLNDVLIRLGIPLNL